MSANLTEGNATGTDAPGGSLATPSAETTPQVAPQNVGDIWAEVAKSETVSTAAPAPQPEAAPTPEPDSSTAVEGEEKPQEAASQDEDKFAKVTNPTRDDWQELRGHKNALETKLKEAEPIAQKVAEVGGARVLDLVAPIFKRYETGRDAVEGIYRGFDGLVKGDPTVKPHVLEAAYLLDPETMWSWAAQDKGLDKLWPEFQQWKQAGSPGPDDAPFPQPDASGYVRLPDGTELFLKDSDGADDPTSQRIYSLEKGQYERGIADRRAERDKLANDTAATRKAETDKAETLKAEATKRTQEFTTARASVLDTAIQALKFDAGSEQETASARLMTLGLFEAIMRQNDGFLKASERGQELAAAGGTLAEDIGAGIDKTAVQTLADAHRMVMDVFNELHTLRQQVGNGSQTAKPADSALPKEIADIDQPPSNGQLPVDPYQKIWQSVG